MDSNSPELVGYPILQWFCKCGRELEYDEKLGWGCGNCGTSNQPVGEWLDEIGKQLDKQQTGEK